jgi:hypothetical protein
MRLVHATTAGALASILRSGLLKRRSKGQKRVVWLASAWRATWACLHCVRRHGGRVESVVVLELNVPRRWLKRGPCRGLYYCDRDVPPGRVRAVQTFSELSARPAPEPAA